MAIKRNGVQLHKVTASQYVAIGGGGVYLINCTAVRRWEVWSVSVATVGLRGQEGRLTSKGRSRQEWDITDSKGKDRGTLPNGFIPEHTARGLEEARSWVCDTIAEASIMALAAPS